MFGFGKPPKDDTCTHTVTHIECEKCKKYEAEIASLRDELTKVTSDYLTQFDDASIDFAKMNAFSIERSEEAKTIIGYFIPKKSGDVRVNEWTLSLSSKKHKELVEQFNEYKSK